MKKSILLPFFFLVVSQSLWAQTDSIINELILKNNFKSTSEVDFLTKKTTFGYSFKLDSLYHRMEPSSAFGPRPHLKTIFIYDSVYNNIESKIFGVGSSQFLIQAFYIHDSAGNCINEYWTQQLPSSIDTIESISRQFDSLGQPIEEISLSGVYGLNRTQWIYTTSLTTQIEAHGNNGNWHPTYKNEIHFNSFGAISRVEEFIRNNNQWNSDGFNQFYYSSNRADSSVYYQVDTSGNSQRLFLHKFWSDPSNTIIIDSMYHQNFNWQAATARHLYYDTLYDNSEIAADYAYNFPFKTDSLKSWKFETSIWAPWDSIVYFYSPVSSPFHIDENISSTHLKIFPNPSSAKISISGLPLKAQYKVEIYNTKAQLMLVSTNSEDDFSLNIAEFSPGIYFLIVTDHENQVFIEKFIKE